MHKSLKLFYHLFFLFIFLQGNISPLFANLEKDEAELFQLLKTRLTPSNNVWESRSNEARIQTLYKTLKDHYQPRAAKDPEAAIKLGHYIALMEDGEEGLSYILPFANQGNALAQYLTGFFWCQMEKKPEAMRFFCDAAIQGHEAALAHLETYANQFENPFAIRELARYFSFKKDKSAEARCLEKIIDHPVLQLPKLLIQGRIRQLQDDFRGALQLYRQAAATDPEEAQAYINLLFEDPNALLQFLKEDALIDGEFEAVEQRLITAVKNNNKHQEELRELALKSPSIAYIYACSLLEPTSKNKKSKRKKKKHNGENDSFVIDCLFFAAGEKHTLAQQKLKQIVDERKQPPLWKHYGTFLAGHGDKEGGAAYLKKAEPKKKPEKKQEDQKKPDSPMQAPPKAAAPKPQVKPTMDWYQIGLSLEKSGKTDQAIKAFEEAHKLNKTEASLRLGKYYYKLSKKAKVETPDQADDMLALDYLLPLANQSHSEALYILGKICYGEKDYKQAKAIWEKALALGCLKATYRLGTLYGWIEKNRDMAEHYFRQAVEKEEIKGYYHAALLCSKLGDIPAEVSNLYYGAIGNHQPCLERLKHQAEEKIEAALLNLGSYYLTKGQHTEARKCWDQMSQSEDSEFTCDLAYNYAKLALIDKDEKKAIELFTKATASMRIGAPAHIALGDIYKEKEEELGKALEHYREAIKIQPQHEKALHNLAILEYLLGNEDLAIMRASDAIQCGNNELFPFLCEIYSKTKNPLAALSIGDVYLQNGNTVEARKYWTIALVSKLPVVKTAAHFKIGLTIFLDGDIGNSVKFGQQALQEGETGFIEYLQILVQKEATSSREQDKKIRAKQVLEKLKIPLVATM